LAANWKRHQPKRFLLSRSWRRWACRGSEPLVEQPYARLPKQQNEDRADDDPADMRPPRDSNVALDERVDELEHDPGRQNDPRRQPRRDFAEDQHPDPDAGVEDQVRRNDARDAT